MVPHLLTEMTRLVKENAFSRGTLQVLYCLADPNPQPHSALDLSLQRCAIKVLCNRTGRLLWSRSFPKLLNAIECTSKFMVIAHDTDKVTILKTASGKKGLLTLQTPNLHFLSLAPDNFLLIVKRNAYFSVINLETGSFAFSGNFFEILSSFVKDPATPKYFTASQVKINISSNLKILLKIEKQIFLYEPKLKMWNVANNPILKTQLGPIPLKLAGFDIPPFPNDPGEIYDSTPFSMLQRQKILSEKYFKTF